MTIRPKHPDTREPAIGTLLVLVGLLALTHAAWAPDAAVAALAMVTLVFGLGIMSMFGASRRAFWPALLGGGLLAVHGIVLLAGGDASGIWPTILVGALLLLDGAARLAWAFVLEERREVMTFAITGAVAVTLGAGALAYVLAASEPIISALIASQALLAGVTVLLSYRLRAGRSPSAAQRQQSVRGSAATRRLAPR